MFGVALHRLRLHRPGQCGIVRDTVKPSGMESTHAIAELDAIRLSDWIDATGLSRSTAYELLKLLQIEPEARRVPTSRKPVSHLSADQLELLQPWAQQLASGTTLPQIRERLGQIDTVQDDGPGRSGIVRDNNPKRSGIVPADQLAAALVAIAGQQQQQPADPLRCARALAEAAELGVPLSSAELAGVVGMSPATVSSWPDGHSPRPGFTLRRQKAGSAVWWLVERPGRSDIVPVDLRPAAGQPLRSVGFAQVFDVQAVTLPRW